MRMVIQIAKAELRNLFYSPVAWFLALVFMVQCGYFFIDGLYEFARQQENMMDSSPDFKNWGQIPLTMLFFAAPKSAYTIMLNSLYLFVPLLTMAMIGREVQANTIKLLYSSPVKLRQIVCGKFLAIMGYNLLLLMIMGIFLITFGFSVKSVDTGFILAGALAFYLLICAYTAIGLFMSSLTNYQIVAAIGTFLIIFVLGRINGFWQKIDFVRDLTWFLHLPGRTERMLKGLIASKDVLYFILVVCMFLGFTLIRLRKQREWKPWYITWFRVLMVVVTTLGVGYLFSRPQTTLYLDATATRSNTIHPRTRALIKEMKDGPLEVTLYTNLLGAEAQYGFPAARNIYLTKFWEQYQRFKTDIHFRYVYYYFYEPAMDNGSLARAFPGKNNEEIAREMAKGHQVDFEDFQPPAEIKNLAAFRDEGYRLLMQLKYKGRTEFLRTYRSTAFPNGAIRTYPSEENVAAVLKRLIKPESIPKVLFTTGHFERRLYRLGNRDYSQATVAKSQKQGPVNLGFDIDTISLKTRDIPEGTTVLAIADPKKEFSAEEQQKIKKYIDEGGNIIFIGEPGKQYVLNPMLKHLGVKMLDGNLVEPTFHEMPQMVKPYYTAASVGLAEENVLRIVKKNLLKKYDRDTLRILMPGVAGLSFDDSSGFVRQPLLLTDGSRSWLKKGKLVVDSAAIVYNPQEGDVKGSFPTVLQLTRQVSGGKQQHVAVFGDADFVSNERTKNGITILRGILSRMTGNKYPIYTPRPDPEDNLMTISSKAAKALKVIYVWVLPALVLFAGIVILVRRNRK